METKRILFLCFIAITCFFSCSDDTTTSEPQTGSLVVDAVNTLASQDLLISEGGFKEQTNRSVNTYTMHTLTFKLTVTEVYVSQGTVTNHGTDDLVWHKIGENSQSKFFEDYTFTANDLPVGYYNSIKITFKNVFYRYAAYQSDPSQTLEMRETMQPYKAPCDDEDALVTNYFTETGNYELDGNTFSTLNEGETLTGFEILPGEVTHIYWKFGDERPWDPLMCTFEWVDENSNGVWDCGIDVMANFQCNYDPPLETMWIFVPVYN